MGQECIFCDFVIFCHSQFVLLRARSVFIYLFFYEQFRLIFGRMFRKLSSREEALLGLAICWTTLEALYIFWGVWHFSRLSVSLQVISLPHSDRVRRRLLFIFDFTLWVWASRVAGDGQGVSLDFKRAISLYIQGRNGLHAWRDGALDFVHFT